ncbi:MAG: ABC transporter permease [Myxococcota bacterium]
MRHTAAIAGRELRSLFVSPVAYVVMALFAVLAGFFFLTTVLQFMEYIARLQAFQVFEQLRQLNLNDHVLTPFFGVMAIVLLFAVPMVTMGLLASEKANGTEELLLTSPITIWELVIGKFLAGAAFVSILVGLVGLYPLMLFLYDAPELGRTGAGVLGLLLLSYTYVAIGLFASSVTRSQMIAVFLALVLLLMLWMVSFLADLGAAGGASVGGMAGVLRYLSTADHLEPLVRGLVDTKDLAYFGLAIAAFLILTKAAVESVRWR